VTDRVSGETAEQLEARARRAADVAAESKDPAAKRGLELEAEQLTKRANALRNRGRRFMLGRR
jgi:hypothetical protein